MNLRDFMNRSRVLSLYRSYMRELYGIDTRAVAELKRTVRDTFKRHASDRAGARGHLAEGERQLQFVKSYVSTARAGSPQGENWVGTGEAYDIRGRVGSGWAWERK